MLPGFHVALSFSPYAPLPDSVSFLECAFSPITGQIFLSDGTGEVLQLAKMFLQAKHG